MERSQSVGAIPTTAIRRLPEGSLYAYGLRVGLHLLADLRLKRALRYLVMPIGYWRSAEYKLVWKEADFQRTDRILDIGSPKLLGLYLAERIGAEVYATDIDDYFVDEYGRLREARRISGGRLHLDVEDGRRLTYPDNFFTKIYSVSVIEHIPDQGDVDCLKEIGRVLRPGGRALITVPFWPTSKAEYRPAKDIYWSEFSVSRPDGRVFYQRRYSLDDLHTRLIEPSGLRVGKLEFVGEHVLTHVDREFVEFLLPPTGPIHPLLSRLIHTHPVSSPDQVEKPLCAFLSLVKE